MLELQERNRINPSVTSQYKDPIYTERSIQSADSCTHKAGTVVPWQGEEYYSRIRKSIHQSNRAQSATLKSANLKSYENRAKQGYSKMNTVQIELAPNPHESLKRSITKWTQPISSQVFIKEHLCPERQIEKEKSCKFTTVSFLEAEPIHQRKPSAKSIRPKLKMVERHQTEVSRKIVESNPNFHQERDDRKGLLFFFQTKNHGIITREKMVMKLRNIEKGRANRVLHHLV